MNITAVILARNEASFIGACVTSVRQVTNDVHVIDSFSTDDTATRASESGASVEQHRWLGYASMRNLALDRFQDSEWVLFVDADERLPSLLAAEIHNAVRADPPAVAGYLIPRKNIICGKVMRSDSWWPDYQLRLLRPGGCRYPESRQVHETPECDGTILALNTPMIHLNYRTWQEFTRKQFAFARLQAPNMPGPRWRSFVGAPGRTFWIRFLKEQGYRDGAHGLKAAIALSLAEFYRVWLGWRASR